MPECISLLRTPLGQTVRLQSLAPLHPSLRRRLTDMGINEGSIIRLKKSVYWAVLLLLNATDNWSASVKIK